MKNTGEMPLKDMLKKRQEIYFALNAIPTNSWIDLYCIDAELPKGTVLVFKSQRNQAVCGVGIFSNTGKMRMAPVYFTDDYYDAAKYKDIIDVYLYNEKTKTMVECACSFYNRHASENSLKYFSILRMPRSYTNIEIIGINDIGSEEIKF